jgi:cell wall-associated NlpC family hydrolase
MTVSVEEAAQRAAVCAEARSWIGTPYHHMGRVKGPVGGVDCAQLVWAVFFNCGLTSFLPHEPYPRDWMLHRSAERYMAIVLDRAREVAEPRPGDVVLYRVGRCFAHGGIVVDPGWPTIVHAYSRARTVTLGDGAAGGLGARPRKFFSRWAA